MPSARGDKAGPAEDVLGRVAPSVLRVVAEGCGGDGAARAGSGFAWRQSGEVVTDLHVIAGCARISVGYQGIDVRPAKVSRVLRRADLALLSVDGPPSVTPLTLAAQPPPVGATLDVFGFALGQPTRDTHPLQVSFANTEAPLLSDVLPDAERADIRKVGFPALDTQVLRLDGNLLPGHSGAPLIDAAGEVVGVGSGGLERGAVGVGWAIRAQYLADLATSTDTAPAVATEALTAFATAVPASAPDPGVRCGAMVLHQRRVARLADIAATSDDPARLEALSADLVQVPLDKLGDDRFAIWTEPQSGAGIVLPIKLPLVAGADFCTVQSLSPAVRYMLRLAPLPARRRGRDWTAAIGDEERRSTALIEQLVGGGVLAERGGAFQSKRWLNGALIWRRMFDGAGANGHPLRLYRSDLAGGRAYILSVVVNDDAEPPETTGVRERLAWARGVFGVHLTAFPPSAGVASSEASP